MYYSWFLEMREIRRLSRFKEFVRESGFVDYWYQFNCPDICYKLGNGDFVCN